MFLARIVLRSTKSFYFILFYCTEDLYSLHVFGVFPDSYFSECFFLFVLVIVLLNELDFVVCFPRCVNSVLLVITGVTWVLPVSPKWRIQNFCSLLIFLLFNSFCFCFPRVLSLYHIFIILISFSPSCACFLFLFALTLLFFSFSYLFHYVFFF
jgi:hypothetical protein